MFTRDTIDDGFTLATERLRLRWPRLADAPAIEKLAGDRAVADMTALIPHPYPEGAAGQFIFAARLANARGDGLTLAVTERKRPHELIGVAAVQPPYFGERAEITHPFIGFWIGAPYWGRGYATEAVKALLDLAFRETGAERIGAETLAHNAACIRVLEKLGFQITGSGMAPFPARGAMLPVARMEIARDRAPGEEADAGRADAAALRRLAALPPAAPQQRALAAE
ncbi:GNAT family N-acetyltransferase [Camelimonas abortus]|uniref:GNAT family N-acetyltransferase n=1 Tax=Camelimonas abortus TaxID=1017184 RepID=A0ABV7LBL5_9HYPH